MEFLTRFLTADVQLWLVAVLCVLSLVAGRLFRRAALAEAGQAPDLDDAYDTDDGEDEPPLSDEPAVVYQAAILPVARYDVPRYDWSGVDPWPVGLWVRPDPRLRDTAQRLARVARRRQLVEPVRAVVAGWWRGWRSKLAEREQGRRERAEAQQTRVWLPGEATTLVTGRVSTGESPELLIRWRHRRSGRVGRVLAALVGGFRRTGAEGRHRAGVALGAIAQRQSRLLALPVGAP